MGEFIGMNAEKTIMIGDDIVGDVKGAQTTGMGYILVRLVQISFNRIMMEPSSSKASFSINILALA